MRRCSYTFLNKFRDVLIEEQCPEEIWEGSDKLCIFHDSSPEKNTELFKQKIEEKLINKDYNFKGYYFPRSWKFENKEFGGYASFFEATFQEDTSFVGTTFREANFTKAAFKEDINFSGVTYQGNAYFRGATFQKDAKFGGATFEKDVDFSRATFQDADFSKATFQKTNFTRAAFKKNVKFGEVAFQRKIHMRRVTFQGNAHFSKATFQDNADFLGVAFHHVYFNGVAFEKDVDFREATFQGNAHFSKATFQDASFREANFQKDANFWGVTFQKYANFWMATFQDADFSRATFQDAVFWGAVIERNLEFAPKEVRNLNLSHFQFLFKGHISADLTRTKFHRADLENVVFTDCMWPDEIYEEIHMEDEKLTFKELETMYRDLKQNMQRHGDYSKAGEFYYREMEMRRKGTEAKKRRLWLELYCILAGYGEKAERTALSSLLTITVFAFLYWTTGCLQHTMGTSMVNPTVYQQLKDAIYFSFVTFTTLGLGDISPLNDLGKLLICCEAVIGAFLIALFVVVFARKMMR